MKQLKSLYYLTVFYLHVSRHKSCVFVADICFLFWHHSHREREREHSQMKEKNTLLFVITDRCHGSLYLFDERKQWKYTGEKKRDSIAYLYESSGNNIQPTILTFICVFATISFYTRIFSVGCFFFLRLHRRRVLWLYSFDPPFQNEKSKP